MRQKNAVGGFAMITVVILMFLLLALALTYFDVMLSEKRLITGSERLLVAEALAEAALEEVLWEYNYNATPFSSGWFGVSPNYSKTNITLTDTSGNTVGTYTTTVTNTSPNPLIVATGTYNSRTATVRAQLKIRATYTTAVFSKETITFSGAGSYTDSYNSSLGAYNLTTNKFQNADVCTLKRNMASAINVGTRSPYVIEGDAATGSGSTISSVSKVSGTVASTANDVIRDATIPFYSTAAAFTAVTPGGTLSTTPVGTPLSGDYYYSQITMNASDTVEVSGSGTTRIQVGTAASPGDITMSGSSQIKILSGGTLELYIYGDVSTTGNSGLNNLNTTQYPSMFRVYGMNTCTSISINGGLDFIGTVYAPYASVSLQGTPSFYGAFVTNYFTASGNGGVHYDELLASTLGSGYEIDWIRRSS